MELPETYTAPTLLPGKTLVKPENFDSVYSLPEDKMLESIINSELNKLSVNDINSLVPDYIVRRKEILNYILSILIFVFVSSIFFHFWLKFYLIWIAILWVFAIFYAIFTRFNLMNYIIKKIKENPKDKIAGVVLYAKNEVNNRYNNSKIWLYILVPIIAPLFIFLQPRIFYEWTGDWYAARIYTFWVLNYKTAEIPETYNGKPVVSLRGNAFSDMYLLESVKLPDTLKEIRGQAFKNCISLKSVNIPKNLEYLGWSAFANATSIKSIVLPDSLTYLWWEAFNWAISLQSVVLSKNLTEIRWDTFMGCTSLKSITIPDGITRIWGSAFYWATRLSEVIIWENSQLEEIGWGAFYNASSLKSIVIPDTVNRIWWEAFYWASSLESVKLPKNLPEIRWDTFEYCTSLRSIDIPDTVTRIWGHAFYGDSSLSQVNIGPASQLSEIWSSAFRLCPRLNNISIPSWTIVNERAFKESPTTIHRF